MTPQHQASGRRLEDVATTAVHDDAEGSYIKHAHEINYSSPRRSGAESLGLTQDRFEDRGFVDAYEDEQPTIPANTYEDFVLYDSDTPFIDEEASTTPNHGSVYNSSSQARYPSMHTSYSPRSRSQNHYSATNPARISQGAYKPEVASHSREGPSLFGEFRLAPTGPTPLDEWAITPHRHEEKAYHFELLPHYTSESASPTPTSSSSSRHRQRKSVKRHRKH